MSHVCISGHDDDDVWQATSVSAAEICWTPIGVGTKVFDTQSGDKRKTTRIQVFIYSWQSRLAYFFSLFFFRFVCFYSHGCVVWMTLTESNFIAPRTKAEQNAMREASWVSAKMRRCPSALTHFLCNFWQRILPLAAFPYFTRSLCRRLTWKGVRCGAYAMLANWSKLYFDPTTCLKPHPYPAKNVIKLDRPFPCWTFSISKAPEIICDNPTRGKRVLIKSDAPSSSASNFGSAFLNYTNTNRCVEVSMAIRLIYRWRRVPPITTIYISNANLLM